MLFRFSSKEDLGKMLALFLMLTILTGCQQSTNSPSSTTNANSLAGVATPTPTPTNIPIPTDTPVPTPIPTDTPVPTPTPTDGPTPIPTQDTSALSVTQGGSFDSGPLHFSTQSFSCIVDIFQPYQYGNIVLAGGNSSYDAGEIAQVVNSMNAKDPSSLPSAFAVVQGGYGTCSGTWEITNTSQSTIQITQVGLRYTAVPQSNNYHYNLVDICSFPGYQEITTICSSGRGGNSDPYEYSFHLGIASSGTVVAGTEIGQQPTPPILNPGDTVKIDFFIGPADASENNYIFSVVPVLQLNTATQQGVLAVQQMSSNIAFFDKSQASCYQLQSNDTFTQLDNSNIPNSADYKIECK